MQEIVVPVDDSQAAWKAAAIGHALAKKLGADLTLFNVADREADMDATQALLEQGTDRLGTSEVAVHRVISRSEAGVASEIESYVDAHPGAVVVMATHGRGRSSAMLGSTADETLRRTFGPILLVGPDVDVGGFEGPVVVAVDGSDFSEHAVPLGVAWAIEFGVAPWVVHCRTDATTSTDPRESGYVSRLARTYAAQSGHEVDFDELHGEHPETAVPEFARDMKASMIVATSHGRTGLRRLTMGSVVSGFVRHATCPVLVEKPPHADE